MVGTSFSAASAQRLKTKQLQQRSSSVSAAFAQRQSHFARRQEEEGVRAQQDGAGANGESRFETTIRRRAASANAAVPQSMLGKGSSSLQGNKFRLSDGPGADGGDGSGRRPKPDLRNSNKRARESADAALALGGLLGAAVADPGAADAAAAAADPRATRRQRLEAVIDKSKEHRAHAAKQRYEGERETSELDREYAALQRLGLVAKRDEIAEERAEFEATGTAEVRALLAAHRATRVGSRSFALTGDGADLRQATDAPDAVASAAPNPAAVAAAAAAVAAAKAAKASGDEGGIDAFDRMANEFRNAPQRAHAVGRTPTATETELREAERTLLALHRGERLRVRGEVEDVTRKEWVERGGDRAHTMDSDPDEDGSSEEGEDEEGAEASDDEEGSDAEDDDEDGSDAEDDDEDESDAEEEKEAAAAKPKKKAALQAPAAAPAAAAALNGAHPVDALLAELEAAANAADGSEPRRRAIGDVIARLHDACAVYGRHAAASFRLVAKEAARLNALGRPQPRFHTAALYAMARLFPVSDFRHPVATPLLLLLPALVMHCGLRTRADVRSGLFHASLLAACLRASRRFCAEPLTLVFNVIGLQAPRTLLEPAAHRGVRVRFPLLPRAADALLASPAPKAGTRVAAATAAVPSAPLAVFDSGDADPAADAAALLAAAYAVLSELAATFADSPAFDAAVAQPFLALAALLDTAGAVHPAVAARHAATVADITALSTAARGARAPLAMRTFRPRPIRQFEPQLADAATSEMKERRELKKELREDRKRVVRQVQAEAAVDRRGREREAAAEDTRRTTKLRGIMADLQQQQHIMNTVDHLMAKSRMKKKKGISGDPTNKGADDGEGGGDGGGGDE